MNTEYRRYIVKVGRQNVMESDSFEEAKRFAIEASCFGEDGYVFDNYEYAIVFRA